MYRKRLYRKRPGTQAVRYDEEVIEMTAARWLRRRDSATPAAAMRRTAGAIRRIHREPGLAPQAGEGLAAPASAAADAGGALPRARNVLAITARPGQESADLGGLLYAFRRTGASLALLSLTRGEASPLNSTCARLETIRPWELLLAANVLGISSLTVADYVDRGLCRYPVAELTERVRRAIREHAADLLLVIDPASGGPDDTAVATATCTAASQAGVPVVARTVAAARGGWMIDLGGYAVTARAVQRSAAAAHVSQSAALPQVERRLASLDAGEHLRWLISSRNAAGHDNKPLAAAGRT
jgi:LmbE family N-acetylglucosaminyl deacetylase